MTRLTYSDAGIANVRWICAPGHFFSPALPTPPSS